MVDVKCDGCGRPFEYVDDGAYYCPTCDEKKGLMEAAADSPWLPEPTLDVVGEIAVWAVRFAKPKSHGAGCWEGHPECMVAVLLKALREGDYAGVTSHTAEGDL